MDQNLNKQQLKIEVNDEIGQGTYSNLVIISHSPSEFVLDFVRIMPGVPKAHVKSRVILTPEHTKRLLNALKENITRFEHQFGPIKNIEEGQAGFNPMAFGGPAGQA